MTRTERRIFILACGLRLLLVVFVRAGHPAGGPGAAATFAVWGGDTFSYLDPVENLLRHGTYAQDLARPDTYAGRLPGYGLVYGMLRLLLAPGAAADVLVLLQVVLGLLALYCLARLAQRATQNPQAFHWTALLFALNAYTPAFDVRILTESFATSALIIGLYTLVKGREREAAGLFLGAGGWLGWAVFLRPFLAPLLVLLALSTVFALSKRGSWRRAVGRGALLLLPFLVADGAWLARNWPWYHRLVPLQSNSWAGYRTAPALTEASQFAGIIGDEPTWWEPTNDLAWLYQPGPARRNPFIDQPRKLAPPPDTADSRNKVRLLLGMAQDSTRPAPQRQWAARRAGQALTRYAAAYQRRRPWQARVVVPLALAYRLTLAHPADYLYRQPYAELSRAQQLLKIGVHLEYLALVGLGLLGLVCSGWPRSWAAGLVKLVPLYLLVLLCGILHQVEFRYFAVAYPFVLVGAVGLMLQIQKWVRVWKRAASIRANSPVPRA